MADYDASSITVLTGLEPVRRRPAMYIGDITDGSGQHNLLWSAAEWGLGEFRAGRGASLCIDIDGDAVTVTDDGDGIPMHPRRHGGTWLHAILTQLHAGGGFHTAAGAGFERWLAGAGLPVVNGLSETLTVDNWRGGGHFRIGFREGLETSPLAQLAPTASTGTRLRFTPDSGIFRRQPWDLDAIRRRARLVCACNPGLVIAAGGETFSYPGGARDLARDLARGAPTVLHDPIAGQSRCGDIDVAIGLQWSYRQESRIEVLANEHALSSGTAHDGLFDGLRAAFATLVPGAYDGVYPAAFREAISRGLSAVVSVRVVDPTFRGQTRLHLTHENTRHAVRDAVREAVRCRLPWYPDELDRLVARLPR